MKCFLSFCLFSISLFPTAWATLKNVTVDDANTTMISYNGDSTSWQHGLKSGLDYDGSHSLGNNDPSVHATFTFTGVAVYYVSSLWPYAVNTTLTLDNDDPVFLNLTDPNATPTDGGSASSPYSVHWVKTGLDNTTHQVVLSVAQGGIYVVVDAFIYTIDDGSASTNSSGNSTDSNHKTSTSVIIIAVCAGALTALVAAGLAAFFWRRRKRYQKVNTHDSWHDLTPAPGPTTDFVPQQSHPPFVSIANSVNNGHMSVSQSPPPTTAPTMQGHMRAESQSNFSPHHRYSVSGASSSVVTGFNSSEPSNSAVLGVASGSSGPSSSSSASGDKSRYVNEKRAQSYVVQNEEPAPPPAYTPSES